MKYQSIILVCLFFSYNLQAQNVGINAGGSTPNSSAILDLNTGNTYTSPNGKGLLFPNVALTGTNDATTVTSAATSLMVYNTATASSGSTAVSPGFYWWNGTKWVAFAGTGSNDWSLTGNAGTAIGTNFLGTTDNVGLQFRTNNVQSGLIDMANFETFFGYNAGLVTTGILNSFFGYGSGMANTTGTGNTAMGYYSLLSNVTGTDNTALGVQSLYYNTGSSNVAVGTNSGFSITSGSSNTALGFYAINNGSNTSTGSNNTAVGNRAVQNLTTGSDNTGVGNQALQLLTTGSFNSATGHLAGLSNTTGSFNVALGYSALKNNSVNDANTAVGGDALFYHAGSYNTGVGMWSLEGSSTVASNTGVCNTAIGMSAGSGYNGAIGSGTPNNYQVTSGSCNTFLGFSSSISAPTYSNSTALGAYALAGASNVIVLGGIAGANGCVTQPKVGIGITTPTDALTVNVPAASSINAITADATGGSGTGNAIYAVTNGQPNYSAIFSQSSPSAAGTGFTISTSNHTIAAQINNNQAYSFAVFGRVVSAPSPSGGVLGYYSGTAWGVLGYHNIANTASYGMYATSGAIGAASLGVSTAQRQSGVISDEQSMNIGLGAYGHLFGAWTRGRVYGMAVKGDAVSLYVDGKTVVNEPIIQLTRSDDKTFINYTPASTSADLQLHGVIAMEKGLASVELDPDVMDQFASIEDLTVMATPRGQTNGVYTEVKDGKLIIRENGNGTASTRISWMIVGKRKFNAEDLPQEIKSADFDKALSNLMSDENGAVPK